MIELLHIKYFEGHEDSTIEFTSGLNLIIGESNAGKSSIIRAMGVVCDNLWQKDMVRTGHTFCEVFLKATNGWVECKRGEGINEWKTFDGKEERSYKNIGTGVPDEVTQILGIGRKKWGEISDMPNFMFQLDKHYMLSEIDGKRASSNLVARMMDNAIGLGGMEELIKALSSDLLRDKKALTEKSTQISELKSTMLDETIYASYKDIVSQCHSLFDDLEKTLESYSDAVELFASYRESVRVRDKISERSLVGFDFDILESELDLAHNMELLADSLIEARNKLVLLPDWSTLGINSAEKEYDEISGLCALYEALERLQKNEQRLKVVDVVCSLPVDDYDNDLDELSKMIKDCTDAIELIKHHSNKYGILCAMKVRMAMDSKEFAKNENRFNELKIELGVCPLCGSSLK